MQGWTFWNAGNTWLGRRLSDNKMVHGGTYSAVLFNAQYSDQEKKMKRKHKELPKARNPFILHLSKRPSGAHGKTKKAERRDERMALRDWIRS